MGTVTHSFSCKFIWCIGDTNQITMNPMVCLFALMATALAAPVPEPESAGWNTALAGLPVGYAGLGHIGALAAPALAAAPVVAAAPAVAAAPVAAVAPAPYVAHEPVISVPAPYSPQH